MRFIVDGMLGSFTRWLRLLGYEAEYLKGANDELLLERAASENAALLTRDVELFRRAKARGLQTYYVEGENESERLSNVAFRFGIRLDVYEALSRCPACGSNLRKAGSDEVQDRVPSGTLRRYSEFWICSCCGKFYWKGRHWKKINETLMRARELLKARGG